MTLTEADVISILDGIKGDKARRIKSKSQTLEGRIKETERQLHQQFKEAFKGMTAKDVIDALKVPPNVEEDTAQESKKTPKYKRFDVVYSPGGPAHEYSVWGANLVESDLYGPKVRTCSHGCLYCYNGAGKENLLPGPTLKSDLLDRLKDDLQKVKACIEHNHQCQPDAPIERVHMTFVGDLYDPELPEGTARSVLTAVREADVPFQVLTKGGTKAVADFDLYVQGDRFGVTLTLDNDTDSRKWEPNAALPLDRIAALKAAHDRGIATWVSLEPVIDPAQTLHLIDLTHDFVGHYGVGKLNTKGQGLWQELKDIEHLIDWHKFRSDAETKLKGYGKSYTIKDDLVEATKDSAEVPPERTLEKYKDYAETLVSAAETNPDALLCEGSIEVFFYLLQYDHDAFVEIFERLKKKLKADDVCRFEAALCPSPPTQKATGLPTEAKPAAEDDLIHKPDGKSTDMCLERNPPVPKPAAADKPKEDDGDDGVDVHGVILFNEKGKKVLLVDKLVDEILSEKQIRVVAGTKNQLAFYRCDIGIYEIGDSVTRLIDKEIDQRVRSSGDYNLLTLTTQAWSKIHKLIAARAKEIGNDFEKRTDLFCCANGVVDLKTGKLLPFDPDYKMLVRCTAKYDPNAICPEFIKALLAVFESDQEKIDYLQLAAGYGTTGETSSDLIFILIGIPGTGKSTITDAIRNALSDDSHTGYSRVIKADLNRKNNGISDGITRAKHARYLQINELDEDNDLSWSTLKELASTSTVREGRKMYTGFENYRILGKMFFNTNHMPISSTPDRSILRRLRPMPFMHVFKDGELDTDTSKKLEQERDGILTWLVKGAMRYYKEGLKETPKFIEDALKRYVSDMDDHGIEEWREARGVEILGKEFETSSKWIRSQDFYGDYQRYISGVNGYEPAKIVQFSKIVAKMGGIKQETKRPNPDLPPEHPIEKTRFWKNITWKPPVGKSALTTPIKGGDSKEIGDLSNY